MTMNITPEAIEAAFAEAAPQRRDLRLCRVGNIIKDYPDLGPRIMDVEHYSARTIVRVLKALGFPPVADSSITAHRKDTCCCPKKEKSA